MFLYLLVEGAEHFPQLIQSLLVPYVDTVPHKVLWIPPKKERRTQKRQGERE